ncbi:MAG TPA: MFS transporter [Candidatus Tectomicrobia bacterium]|nr:MFS transporter [Candidatus Tectomicrobia bacterium]
MRLLASATPFARATITNFFFFLALNPFVLLPLHIQALGGTEADVGLVMGLYSAAGIVCQPLIGPWVDVLGRRPFMLGGIALVLLAALLAVAPAGIAGLALVRLLQGVGFSLFFVASFSYVVDIVPPGERGWALGIYGVSGFVATAVAPLVGESIIRTAGFVPLFLLSALLTVVPFALVWPLREPRRGPVPAAPEPGRARSALEDVLHVDMVLTAFFGLGSGAVFAFVPTFAESLGVRALSLFYTAYAGAAIAIRVAGGRLIDTRGRRAVIVPSMFVQVLATALLSFVGVLAERGRTGPVLPALALTGLLSGGAHGFLYPGLAALITDRTPETRRAAVVGVFSAMYLAGNAAGAFVFGLVAHTLGYAAMWWLLAVALLLGAVVSLRLARPAPAA